MDGFLATSTGSNVGLDNKYGGLCASHHLKMVIHVTDKNGDTSSKFVHMVSVRLSVCLSICLFSQILPLLTSALSGHIHRIHKKLTTTTVSSTDTAESQWPSDPLWGEFFEKVSCLMSLSNQAVNPQFALQVGRGENPIWPTATRGERLSLDTGSRRHEYEALALGDEVDFQIHEIGDGKVVSI